VPERIKDDREKICPTSFAQERLWLLDRLEPGNPAYNIVRAIRVRGSLSTEALRESLGAIVARAPTGGTRRSDISPPQSSSGGSGNRTNSSEDTLGKKWSAKQAARMRQDRLRDTGKASRYPLESPTLTHAAAGEKNKDHKEVGDTPGIDPPVE